MDLCGCTLDIEAPGLRHPKRAMAPHETLYYIRIAEALLQRGANTNIVSKVLKSQTLYFGSLFGSLFGYAMAQGGKTALGAAVGGGWIEMANLLLYYHADPNLRGYDSKTPLITAADRQNVKMVDLLLYYGADPSMKDRFGSSPLP